MLTHSRLFQLIFSIVPDLSCLVIPQNHRRREVILSGMPSLLGECWCTGPCASAVPDLASSTKPISLYRSDCTAEALLASLFGNYLLRLDEIGVFIGWQFANKAKEFIYTLNWLMCLLVCRTLFVPSFDFFYNREVSYLWAVVMLFVSFEFCLEMSLF